MKVILLSLLFSLPNGQIITGNQVNGWHDREQPSMEVCIKRSKYIFAHPENKPKWATSMVAFCKVIIR